MKHLVVYIEKDNQLPDWLSKFPQEQYKHIIYNYDDYPTFAHAIFHHIVSHYDSISSVIFLRSNPLSYIKNKTIDGLISDTVTNKYPMLFLGNIQNVPGNDAVTKFIEKHIEYNNNVYPYVDGYQFQTNSIGIQIFTKSYYQYLLDELIKNPKFESIIAITLITLYSSYVAKRLNKPNTLCKVVQQFNSNKKDTVYVIRTHVMNDNVYKMFQKCMHEFGPENTFILYDDTKNKINNHLIPSKRWTEPQAYGPYIALVNEEECNKLNPLHKHPKPEVGGSGFRADTHIAVITSFIKRKFDYMWFIEYDVYCHGSLKEALKESNDTHFDFITTKYRTAESEPSWIWWNDLYGELKTLSIDMRTGCFFPLNRFSRRFLESIIDNLGQSSGFCEIYPVTLCKLYNYTISEIPIKSLGTFNYRPTIPWSYFKGIKYDNRLYHPVKDI
jgi:hypothetical protein